MTKRRIVSRLLIIGATLLAVLLVANQLFSMHQVEKEAAV